MDAQLAWTLPGQLASNRGAVKILKRMSANFVFGVEGLGKVLIVIPAVLGFFMVLLITVNVFLRYGFASPIKWEFEIVEDIIAFVFLGLAYIHSKEKYIHVEILTERLSPKAQTILKIFGCVAGLVFFGFMTKGGWDYAWPALQTGLVSANISRLPVGPVRLMIPIGAGLLCLQLIIMLVRYIASLTVSRINQGQ